MLNHSIKFVILFILLILFSCKQKQVATVSQVSSDPQAQEAFDEFMNIFNSEGQISDSLVFRKFIHARSLLEDEGLMLLYRKTGEYYYAKENVDSSLKYFQTGLEIAKTERNTFYTSLFHLMLGSVYTQISEFDPALAEMKEAYRLSKTLDSLRLQIRTARNLGNVYWNMGNYDLALEYYMISLEISEKSRNNLGIASALNNIGNVYQEVNNYERAIEYYKKSEPIAEANDFSRIIAVVNNNLGDVYSITGNYDSAKFYFNKAIEEVKNVGSKFDAGIYIGNIADLYLKTDSLDKAELNFLESRNYAVETGDKTGIANCDLGLAKIYLKRNKIREASEYLFLATGMSEEIGSLKLTERCYALYSEYYALRKDYFNSRFYLNKQMEVKDSIYSQENGQNVARLENQYKEIKSMQEIDLLKEKQKNILYISSLGIAAFVVISFLIFLAYRQKNRSNLLLKEKNQQIETAQLILEAKNKELILSQEQLNKVNKGKDDFLTIISHDLKNLISSIRGFTELLIRQYGSFSDEERKTFLIEMFDSIERISLLINNILYWVRSQTDGVLIKPVGFNLAKRLEENISLYKLMLVNKKINLENRVPDDIMVLADTNVFDMIIRNIISNSLKFTPPGGKISINMIKTDSKINLQITDNGIGIPEDKLNLILSRKEHYSTTGTSHEQGTGLGLGLVFQFIEETGEKFSIESTSEKGTSINFTLSSVS